MVLERVKLTKCCCLQTFERPNKQVLNPLRASADAGAMAEDGGAGGDVSADILAIRDAVQPLARPGKPTSLPREAARA